MVNVPRAGARNLPVLSLLVAACAVLVVAGSLGPWASVLGTARYGYDGDGVVTLFLGAFGGILALWNALGGERRGLWRDINMLSVFVLSMLIGLFDWVDIERVAGANRLPSEVVEVEWGLMLVTIAGGAGAILSAIILVREQRA